MSISGHATRFSVPARLAYVVDTTALILFFTTTGVLNERFVAGRA